MATRGPAPVDTGVTPVVTRPVDRAPAPVPPGPGSTGQIPTVKKPAGPPEAAAPAVTPNAGIAVPPVSTPQGPPETVPPAVTPGPATGQSTSANVTPTVPVQELPVDTPNVDAGNNVIPNINYIQVLANGTVVVSKTTALNFAGSGVTVTGSNGAATITISGSSYGNSNVVTLLSAFGSNTVSTTGNVTGGYILGNGSQLTGLPAIYGNANVVANLAALGSNPVSTTGNVTGGNLLTGAQVVASGVIQTGTGFSTGGYLSVDGDTDLHKTTVTGNLSATGNVTGGNVLTGGIISATGNIFGGNAVFTGNLSVAGNVTYINSNVVTINDLAINLANNAANISLINGGGIELGPQGTPYVTFLYNTSANTFTSNVGLSAVANITGGNVLTAGLISATSTITSAANITGGNVLTAGLISASGNVTGGYLFGNGSQLTGLPATYGNANVVANLAALGSNPVSTTGNVSAGYLFGNGSQLTGIAASGNTGNVTFSDQVVIGTGSNDGSGGLYLAPGNASIANSAVQYLRVRGGDVVTHIHLDTGNNQYYDQYFGDDGKYMKLANTGNVVIGSDDAVGNSAQWTFGTSGNLTLPRGGVVYETNIPDGGLNGNTIALKPSGGTNADQQLLIYPTTNDANHLHLTTGNLYNTELFLGDDNLFVKLANTGNVVINSNDGTGNSAQWTFGTNGNLTLPANTFAVNYANGTAVSLGGAGSYGNANVVANLAALGSNPVSTTGNITGGYILGNGSQLTAVNAVTVDVTDTNGLTTIYYPTFVENRTTAQIARADVNLTYRTDDNLLTVGNVSVTGNIDGGNLITSAAISTASVSASGNITAGNLNAAGLSLSSNVVSALNVTGAIAGANVTTPGLISATANVTAGNILTGGIISATGNVSGNYFIGNGSQLTGIAASYGNANVATFLAAYGSNTISTSGNITAGNFIGNGASLTNVTVSVAGNIVGTSSNVSLVAGSYTTTFDNTGNTAFANGTVSVTTLTASGNVTGGNILTGGLISATGNVSAAGNVTAANFFGNGNTLSNVATRFESSWTVPTGNSTQSFTVAASETYYLWVDCNIPNGILAWNATATVTNTNVPVVGAQYAWVYNGGGTPIDFTSIPGQFVGTANTILRSNVAPSATTNRFDFGLNNTSGGSVTVRYGWVAIS